MRKVCFIVLSWIIGCSNIKTNDKDIDGDAKKHEGIILPEVFHEEYMHQGDEGDEISKEVNQNETIPTITSPVQFRVGVAVRRMPVPLGINTSGFGPVSGGKSPFAGPIYPATTGIYMHPTIKAVFVEGGMGRVIFVLGDLVGMSSVARETIIKRLQKRTKQDFSNELIIGGTHTHSGPGRMTQGAFELVQDKFFPEFFDRMMDAIVDTVIDAYKDLTPARFGFVIAENHKAHSDRRCENPEFEVGDLPILRFDDQNGKIKTIILTYAVHSTVLDNKEFMLSKDVAGGIEYKVEELFDHYCPVLMFDSWGADMAPGTPPSPSNQGQYSDVPEKFTRIEGIGNMIAETVANVIQSVETKAGIDVSALTMWIPIDRKYLGYPEDVFPYDYGGVYCGGTQKGHCWTPGVSPDPIKDLDKNCIPFTSELPAPNKTLATVGRIGDLILVTFPGEAVTQIGVDIRDKISALAGGKKVAFFGYSQDYMGYSTPEWDWWQGGYEASGAIWGPKQGDYLAARIVEVAKKFFDKSYKMSFTSPFPFSPPLLEYEPRKYMESIEPGKVITDVQSQYAKTDTVVFEVLGGDPWLLAPVVYLEKKEGETFVPYYKSNKTPVNSDGYEFWVTMKPDPPYPPNGEDDFIPRRFLWKFVLPITRVADMKSPIIQGTYRLRMVGSYADGSGKVQDISVVSSEFTIQQ